MGLRDLNYKPRSASKRIILDDGLRVAVEEARVALNDQRQIDLRGEGGLGSPLAELEQRLVDAEAAADEAAVTFTFQAIPRHRIAELVAECPPTTEQLERWMQAVRAMPLVNRTPPEADDAKYAPRLIAASLIEPESSDAEVLEMWETGDWSDAIWAELYDLALSVNQEVSTRPTFGTGIKRT
jgi:hypothetical protein